jgi:AcrR family transcriptional regulator
MPKISESRREKRRRQILDAALACFSENGFHQTSMPDIVNRSGLSHGAVYVYFKSKDDIILALAVDRHRQEAVLNSVIGQFGGPLVSLRALVRAYAALLADPSGDALRRVGVNGWAEALRNERVHASVVEGVAAPVAVVAALVERAQAEGSISADIHAETVGRALVALFQGFTLQVAWGQAVDIEAAVAVIDRMLFGLAPTAQQTAWTQPNGDW